jgi:hypothetical protein
LADSLAADGFSALNSPEGATVPTTPAMMTEFGFNVVIGAMPG